MKADKLWGVSYSPGIMKSLLLRAGASELRSLQFSQSPSFAPEGSSTILRDSSVRWKVNLRKISMYFVNHLTLLESSCYFELPAST